MLNTNIGLYVDLRYFTINFNNYLNMDRIFDIEAFIRFIEYEIAADLNKPMPHCKVNSNEVRFYGGGAANTECDRLIEDMLIKAGFGKGNIIRSALVGTREKGVDGQLMLDAFESAKDKKFQALALVSGDADFHPLAKKLRNELGIPVYLFFWDNPSSNTRTAQVLIESVTKPFAMHELLQSRTNRNPFTVDLLRPKEAKPKAAIPVNIGNSATPAKDLRALLEETARECKQGEDGWILGADFGIFLKMVKKYDPQKEGKKLFELIQDYPDAFETRSSPFAVRLRNQVQLKTEISSSSVPNTVKARISAPRQLTLDEKAETHEAEIMAIDPVLNWAYIRSPWRFANEKWNNFHFFPSDIQNRGNKAVDKGTIVRFNLADDPFRSMKFGVPLYKAVNVEVIS